MDERRTVTIIAQTTVNPDDLYYDSLAKNGIPYRLRYLRQCRQLR